MDKCSFRDVTRLVVSLLALKLRRNLLGYVVARFCSARLLVARGSFVRPRPAIPLLVPIVPGSFFSMPDQETVRESTAGMGLLIM
jgi:hypothetical protein